MSSINAEFELDQRSINPIIGRLESERNTPSGPGYKGWRWLQCTETPGEYRILIPPKIATAYAHLLRTEQIKVTGGSEDLEYIAYLRRLKKRLINRALKLFKYHPQRDSFKLQTHYAPESFRLRQLEKWYKDQVKARGGPPPGKHWHSLRGMHDHCLPPSENDNAIQEANGHPPPSENQSDPRQLHGPPSAPPNQNPDSHPRNHSPSVAFGRDESNPPPTLLSRLGSLDKSSHQGDSVHVTPRFGRTEFTTIVTDNSTEIGPRAPPCSSPLTELVPSIHRNYSSEISVLQRMEPKRQNHEREALAQESSAPVHSTSQRSSPIAQQSSRVSSSLLLMYKKSLMDILHEAPRSPRISIEVMSAGVINRNTFPSPSEVPGPVPDIDALTHSNANAFKKISQGLPRPIAQKSQPPVHKSSVMPPSPTSSEPELPRRPVSEQTPRKSRWKTPKNHPGARPPTGTPEKLQQVEAHRSIKGKGKEIVPDTFRKVTDDIGVAAAAAAAAAAEPSGGGPSTVHLGILQPSEVHGRGSPSHKKTTVEPERKSTADLDPSSSEVVTEVLRTATSSNHSPGSGPHATPSPAALQRSQRTSSRSLLNATQAPLPTRKPSLQPPFDNSQTDKPSAGVPADASKAPGSPVAPGSRSMEITSFPSFQLPPLDDFPNRLEPRASNHTATSPSPVVSRPRPIRIQSVQSSQVPPLDNISSSLESGVPNHTVTGSSPAVPRSRSTGRSVQFSQLPPRDTFSTRLEPGVANYTVTSPAPAASANSREPVVRAVSSDTVPMSLRSPTYFAYARHPPADPLRLSNTSTLNLTRPLPPDSPLPILRERLRRNRHNPHKVKFVPGLKGSIGDSDSRGSRSRFHSTLGKGSLLGRYGGAPSSQSAWKGRYSKWVDRVLRRKDNLKTRGLRISLPLSPRHQEFTYDQRLFAFTRQLHVPISDTDADSDTSS